MGKVEINTASKKFYKCDKCNSSVSSSLAICETCNNTLSEISKSIWKDTISSSFYREMNLSVERVNRIKKTALWVMLFSGFNTLLGLILLTNRSLEFSTAYTTQTLYVVTGFSLLTASIAFSIRNNIYTAKEKINILILLFSIAFLFGHGDIFFNKYITAIPLFIIVKERYRIYKNRELKSEK